MPKVAPKGTKHRPSSAPLLPAVPHRPAAALRRTRRRRSTLRAAVWPQSCTAVASQSRRRACDIALRRHACASPTLSMRALPARTPCERHLNPSSEPAGGSLLPSPRPLQRAAQQRHHRWLYTVSAFHQSHSSSIMSDVGAQGLDQLGDNSRAWGSSGMVVNFEKANCKICIECRMKSA